MASLYVWNYLSMNNDGAETTAKHGTTTEPAQTPLTITATGVVNDQKGVLTTGSVATMWSSANFLPATFLYAFLWVDQIAYLQVIGSTSHAIHKLAAKQPFVLPGYNSILGVVSTTVIAAEPTMETVSKLVLGNFSGSTLNYRMAVIL